MPRYWNLINLADQVFTPCTEAIAVFLVDVVLFVLNLAGLRLPNGGPFAKAIILQLGEQRIRGFLKAITKFNLASNANEKAKAIFELVVAMYYADIFRAVFTVIKDKMSWLDWLTTGVIAVAQITAWILSGGAALIIKAALSIMSATQLLKDGIKAAKVCNC